MKYHVQPCLHLYPPTEVVEADSEEEAHRSVVEKWKAHTDALIKAGHFPQMTGDDHDTHFER